MGKLSVTVVSCKLWRTPRHPGKVTSFVRILVDGKFVFTTKQKRDDYAPVFLETFVVGNTHRFAVIEVTVFHRDEHGMEVPLGSCTVSASRLTRGAEKVREHWLLTDASMPTISSDVTTNLGISAATLAGPKRLMVSGSIVLSLFSDELGEYELSLNSQVEGEFVRRIRRLCLRYNHQLLKSVDLIIADVREPFELPSKAKTQNSTAASVSARQQHSGGNSREGANSSSTTDERNIDLGGKRPQQPTSSFGSTFTDVLQKLVQQLGPEVTPKTLRVDVDGASALSPPSEEADGAASNSIVVNPYFIVRSESQVFLTKELLATRDPIYPRGNAFEFEVFDVDAFRLDFVAMSRSRNVDEVMLGAASITVHSLSQGFGVRRHLTLTSPRGEVTGVLHVQLTAADFGLLAQQDADCVTDRIKQLTKFLIRYEPSAIPWVDRIVMQQHAVWPSFMSRLIQYYGREPGSMLLEVVVKSVSCLKRSEDDPWPDEKPVFVALRMRDTHVKTMERTYRSFQETMFDEAFVIDVARETDEVEMEVVDASTGNTIGLVDITVLRIRRGVHQSRNFFLVANPATAKAHCAGTISVSLFSETIGVDYDADCESEQYYTKRLFYFCQRYLPQKLHRVSIAVSTTDDLETFLSDLRAQYGAEEASIRLALTVEEVQDIGSRYATLHAQVVVEAGVERHETRVARASAAPQFDETWVIDLPVSSSVFEPSSGNSFAALSASFNDYLQTRVSDSDPAAFASLMVPTRGGAVGSSASLIHFKLVVTNGDRSNSYFVGTAVMPLRGLECNRTERLQLPIAYRSEVDVVDYHGVLVVKYYAHSIGAPCGLTEPLRAAPRESASPLRNLSLASPLRSRLAAGLEESALLRLSVSALSEPANGPADGSGYAPWWITVELLKDLPQLVPATMLGGGGGAASASSALKAAQKAIFGSLGAASTSSSGQNSGAVQHFVSYSVFSVAEDMDDGALSRGGGGGVSTTGRPESLMGSSAAIAYDANKVSFRDRRRLLLFRPPTTDQSLLGASATTMTTNANANANALRAAASPSGPGYARIVVYVSASYDADAVTDAIQESEAAESNAPAPLRTHRQVLGEVCVTSKGLPPHPLNRGKLLPIVRFAGTRAAVVSGWAFVRVGLDASGGGVMGSVSSEVGSPLRKRNLSTEAGEDRIRHRAVRILSEIAPQELHRVDLIVSEFQGVEEQLVPWLNAQFSAAGGDDVAVVDAGSPSSSRWMVRGGDTPSTGAGAANFVESRSALAAPTATVTIHDVRLLGNGDEGKEPERSCFVKVKAGREKFRTATRSGHRCLTFEETFTFKLITVDSLRESSLGHGMHRSSSTASQATSLRALQSPPAIASGSGDGAASTAQGSLDVLSGVSVHLDECNAIRLQLCDSGVFFGNSFADVYVSLQGIQRHVHKESVHTMIRLGTPTAASSSRTGAGMPCALVRLSIYSDFAGRAEAVDDALERSMQLRLRNFLKCYVPDELRRLDLFVAAAATSYEQSERTIRALVERHGPEPGHNTLEVEVVGCDGTLKTDSSGGHSRPFVVLRCGISLFQTRACYATEPSFNFYEIFTFDIGLPHQDELLVMLMDEPLSGNGVENGTESGRVLVSLLTVRRGHPTRRVLPLIYRAGTKEAVVYGSITLIFNTRHFGLSSAPNLSDEAYAEYQQRVLRLLARFAPEHLHRYDVIMGRFVNREDDLIKHLIDKYGAEPGSYPVYLRILGLRGTRPGTSNDRQLIKVGQAFLDDRRYRDVSDLPCLAGHDLKIKVLTNGVPILKTSKAVRIECGVATLAASTHNSTVLTEVCNVDDTVISFQVAAKGVFRKTLLAEAEMGLRDLVKDFSNVRWLHLFHVEQGVPLGFIGVEIRSSAFGLSSSKRDDEAAEDVAVDLVSLMQKFEPRDLKQLDIILERAPKLSEAHSLLRRKYQPKAVGTVYVTIHEVTLSLEQRRRDLVGQLTMNGAAPDNEIHQVLRGAGQRAVGSLGSVDSASWAQTPVEPPILWRKGEQEKCIRVFGTCCGETVHTIGSCRSNSFSRAPFASSSSTGRPCGVLRFDVVPPAVVDVGRESSTHLSIRVGEWHGGGGSVVDAPLGAAEVSIKALLTPGFAAPTTSLEERVVVPIVLIQQTSAAVDAFVTGTITISVSRPSFESAPKCLMFPESLMAEVDVNEVWSLYDRIQSMLRAYDPASLLSFSKDFFEEVAAAGATWRTALNRWLERLVRDWGPEIPTDYH